MTEYDFSPEGYRRHMEKQEVVRRWTENTGRYRPADPYVPATPAVHAARALKQTGEYRSSDSGSYRDGYRSDREYSRERNGSSGNKKHRSRSVGESKHSRSNSYSYTPQYSSPVGYQAPVIPGPFPQSYPQHPQPKRSATMPMPPPPPVPPMPSPPRRSMTTTTSTPPGYGYYYPTRGEPLMIPQGGIAILPPGAITPKMISPPVSPRHNSYQQTPPQSSTPSKLKSSWLSKLGSIFSPRERTPSPPGMVLVHQKPKRSKSSKHGHGGKSRRSSRSGHGHRGERRYSY